MTTNEVSTVFWSMLGTLMFVLFLGYFPSWVRFIVVGGLIVGLVLAAAVRVVWNEWERRGF